MSIMNNKLSMHGQLSIGLYGYMSILWTIDYKIFTLELKFQEMSYNELNIMVFSLNIQFEPFYEEKRLIVTHNSTNY